MSRVMAAYTCTQSSGLLASNPPSDATLAESYLTQISELPLTIDSSLPAHRRVIDQLAAAMQILTDKPRLAAACTRALLNTDHPVAHVQSRIGAEIHRRVTSALGTGAWPEVVTTVETMFWGVLIQTQTEALDFPTAVARLDTMVSLVLTD